MPDTARVALLIDGENLSVDHAGFTIRKSVELGDLTIKRVYGNIARIGKWSEAPGFRAVHAPAGKNIGDISLSLDAMELALTGQADVFVIASSDRDLALVALRLRELGFDVLGLGEEKAPDQFKKACKRFEIVPGRKANPPAATTNGADDDFVGRMKRFMKQTGDADGWVSLNQLGQQKAKDAGISKEAAGLGKSRSWLDWFEKHQPDYEIDKRGTQSRARPRKSSK